MVFIYEIPLQNARLDQKHALKPAKWKSDCQLRIVDERTLTAASGNSSPTTVRARLDVYLTGDRVDSSGKMVDNVAKTVQPYEIDNLRRHEREILARVSTTYAAPRTDR